MQNDTLKYLQLLFDEGDGVCIGQEKAWQVSLRYAVQPDNFVCINALDLERDRHPEKDWHNTNKPRRADHNVTKHRNFLVECDNLSTDEQMRLVQGSGLPYSCCVYSGKKSLHFIVSLNTPLPSIEVYRAASKRLLWGLYCLGIPCDQSTGNPSRLSRLPGVLRGENMQGLVEIKTRVPNLVFWDWVLSLPTRPMKPRRTIVYTGEKLPAPVWVQKSILDDILGPSGSRSQTVFALAFELCCCGWTPQEITCYLAPLQRWFSDGSYPGNRVDQKITEAVKAFQSKWRQA